MAKARFVELADMAGHSMYRADVEGDELVVELRTEAMGGVTQSDFILAARLNQIDLSDLKAAKKRQFWA